jgi:hypothetical protein
VQRRSLPEDHQDTAASLSNLATCHSDQGEYGKAVLLQEEALAVERRLLPEDLPNIARSLNNLANFHSHQGEYGKAVLLNEEALAVQRRSLPEDHPHIATSLHNLANCHADQGEYGKAALQHEEALSVRRRRLPEDHLDTASSLHHLANCHRRQGEYGKAVLLHEEALECGGGCYRVTTPIWDGLHSASVRPCSARVTTPGRCLTSRMPRPHCPSHSRQTTPSFVKSWRLLECSGSFCRLHQASHRRSAFSRGGGPGGCGLVEQVGGRAEGVPAVPGVVCDHSPCCHIGGEGGSS